MPAYAYAVKRIDDRHDCSNPPLSPLQASILRLNVAGDRHKHFLTCGFGTIFTTFGGL